MIYFLIGIIGTILWIAFEVYRAPEMDDNGKITKEGKNIKDDTLFGLNSYFKSLSDARKIFEEAGLLKKHQNNLEIQIL